ncbi:hypothetical protein DIPPA_23504 [Diplonema papillatum]|nr:hypothetical protein DIPPA_23504 [Diplonema papillatum]
MKRARVVRVERRRFRDEDGGAPAGDDGGEVECGLPEIRASSRVTNIIRHMEAPPGAESRDLQLAEAMRRIVRFSPPAPSAVRLPASTHPALSGPTPETVLRRHGIVASKPSTARPKNAISRLGTRGAPSSPAAPLRPAPASAPPDFSASSAVALTLTSTDSYGHTQTLALKYSQIDDPPPPPKSSPRSDAAPPVSDSAEFAGGSSTEGSAEAPARGLLSNRTQSLVDRAESERLRAAAFFEDRSHSEIVAPLQTVAFRFLASGSSFGDCEDEPADARSRGAESLASHDEPSAEPAKAEEGASLDSVIHQKLTEFVVDLFHGEAGVRNMATDITTGRLPPQASYRLLHPLSEVKDAVDVPKELVVWRVLKSSTAENKQGAPEATAAEPATRTRGKSKAGLTRWKRARCRTPSPSARSPQRAAAASARRWYANAAAAADRVGGYGASGKDFVSDGGGAGGPPPVSFRAAKGAKPPGHAPHAASQAAPFDASLLEDDDDDAMSSSSSDGESGSRHRKQMERVLLARRLLWGADSDDEAADDALWRSTMQRTMREKSKMQIFPKDVGNKKQEIWETVLRRRNAGRSATAPAPSGQRRASERSTSPEISSDEDW